MANKIKMNEIDLSAYGFDQDDRHATYDNNVIGEVRFPYLASPCPGPYDAGKYVVTLLLPKGEHGNDAFAAAVNAAHADVGGRGDVIKDGDSYKPDFHAGTWVMKLKQGPSNPPKVVNADAEPLDPASIKMGDVCRVRPRVLSYSAGGSTGVTLYFQWIQLVEKSSRARAGDIPVYGKPKAAADSELPLSADAGPTPMSVQKAETGAYAFLAEREIANGNGGPNVSDIQRRVTNRLG